MRGLKEVTSRVGSLRKAQKRRQSVVDEIPQEVRLASKPQPSDTGLLIQINTKKQLEADGDQSKP